MTPHDDDIINNVKILTKRGTNKIYVIIPKNITIIPQTKYLNMQFFCESK